MRAEGETTSRSRPRFFSAFRGSVRALGHAARGAGTGRAHRHRAAQMLPVMGLRVADRIDLGNREWSFTAPAGSLHLSREGTPLFSVGGVSREAGSAGGEFAVEIPGRLSVNGSVVAAELDVISSPLPQWTLVSSELFNTPPVGWSVNLTSTCGGPHKILGGHCRLAATPIDKHYTGLPPHRTVRVQARFAFIDRWERASAWMMLDRATVWTQQHAACASCAGARSICGRDDAPDRVGVLIDVTQPHAAAELTVGFGTQGLDGADPCLVSYGVQGVSIYVR